MSATHGGDFGFAGRSARLEYERRRRRREEFAPTGLRRTAAALFGPSAAERRRLAEERAWNDGAQGEEFVAQALAGRAPGVPILHDRRMPGGRANIDHIALAASGIYVIDTKRYKGKIEVHVPLFGSPQLRIAGRDRTKLIDGLETQVAVVSRAVEDVAPEAPIHGCLCFVAPEGLFSEVELPLLRTYKIRGYPLYHVRLLAARLNSDGPLSPSQALLIGQRLAERLPPA